MLTITGTNLATIKEPKMRAKYGAGQSENVSFRVCTRTFFFLYYGIIINIIDNTRTATDWIW